jgi:hypothetical protein
MVCPTDERTAKVVSHGKKSAKGNSDKARKQAHQSRAGKKPAPLLADLEVLVNLGTYLRL